MAKSMTLPHLAKNPYAWVMTFVLATIAWIQTVQQTLSMFPMRMYGTMGLSLAPFLLFWTIMMAAMMLPALAPTVSLQYMFMQTQTLSIMTRAVRISTFILGYLSVWLLFGIPAYFLAILGVQLIFHAPIVGVGFGIVLFIVAGLYQMMPLKQYCLTHCNPSVEHQLACHRTLSPTGWLSNAKSGLLHGLFCLGCCGNLMLVLLAVGFMNLPWMLLVTGAIFLEKVWSQGPRLSFYPGAVLLFYGLLAFINPSLLPGLYMGHF